MSTPKADEIRQAVRQTYGEVAKNGGFACGRSPCAGGDSTTTTQIAPTQLGYTQQELAEIPQGAEMGLGCGNPRAIAALQPGQVVLDLGSGGGVDCFLAAKQVGETGEVIGVDMTPEMIAKARENAAKGGYDNVDFRLGEIERLPVADASVDAIISNCVVNLSPDKPSVYREAYRVLKPGGRLAISDVVATAPLPEEVRQDIALVSGCVAGAATVAELEEMLTEVGFQDARIRPDEKSRQLIRDWAPGSGVEDYVASATVEATKPGG